MGCIESQPEPSDAHEDAEIDDDEPRKDKSKKKGVTLRILILGTAEVGKSTFFKQIRILHAEKFTAEEITLFRKIVFRNIHTGMMNLVGAAKSCGIDLSKYDPEVSAFRDFPMSDTLDQAKYSAAKTLWKSAEIQQVIKESQVLLADPHIAYFLTSIDNYMSPDYVLTTEDIVRLRQRTIGMPTLQFPFQKRDIEMVDFGGQEVERKKWPLLAEGAKCIIFLASLTHFEIMSDEDKSKTRLEVSIDVFGQVLREPAFSQCTVILFLNKWDLFQEQVKQGNFAKKFPDAKVTDPKSCAEYIEQLYREQLPGSEHDALVAHVTTATDTTVMNKVFSIVLGEVLRKNLSAMGLVMSD